MKDIFFTIITYMTGRWGYRLRYFFYKRKMKYLDPTAIIDVGVQIINPESISIGANTHIDRFTILVGGIPGKKDDREINYKENKNFPYSVGELIIGNNCHIAPMCLLSGIGGLWIGNNVTVSSSTKIYSHSHHYRSFIKPGDKKYAFGSYVPKDCQALISGPVVLEQNVGVAVNSMILPGVTIERESFVGIGSVVYKNVPTNNIVAGNPAKFIKLRFEESE